MSINRWQACIGLFALLLPAAGMDLSSAVVVAPQNASALENKAVTVLIEEIEKRTELRLTRSAAWPKDGIPVIAVGPVSSVNSFAGPYAASLPMDAASKRPEGYRIHTQPGKAVVIAGNDSRGVLYGVGHLLRTLELSKRKIDLPLDLNVTTAPEASLRGHQLGYRPKTNSYDGWTLPMWDQYIRDLAIFGTNAIELIPPRSDDDADSPHFLLPQMEMMIGMSQLAFDYGMDVWIWYPAMDPDYSKPETVDFALKEWGEVLRKLPHVDAIFVPGGDPGHTRPRYLMALLEKQTQVLHKYHPKAQMWVSPQSFTAEWLDEFYELLKKEPAWLSGLVYGPQTRVSLASLREHVPKRYPIRHYPDITHSRQAQFPVPDWDLAYALTEGREPINPRPLGHAHIYRFFQKDTIGFITYSEGCNDDVNKFVWSALGWKREAEVVQILRDYSRYFIGPRYADAFAQGLLALEKNWQGPLATNGNVYTTLEQFQALEKTASPQDLLNWRFQQALYRAYYDAYTRGRLLFESSLEDQAIGTLRQARLTGAVPAMSRAETILERAVFERTAQDWRARIFELAEALYQSIRMQLSVPRYKAIGVSRGANLDTVDVPLNSRLWLKSQFDEIRGIPTEAARVARLDEIVNRENPGPGGFYDDLGNLTRQPHLVRGSGFDADPEFRESSLVGFSNHGSNPRRPVDDEGILGMGLIPYGPRAWWDQAESLYDAPLKMRYTGLDPHAKYRIRVVYAGDSAQPQIRLVAGGKYEIHGFIRKEYRPVEFDIPAEATADGSLELSWTQQPGQGGSGRGCQVAEVWLIKR